MLVFSLIRIQRTKAALLLQFLKIFDDLSDCVGPVYSASLSPDARFMLTASEDKTARLWSLETNSCLVAYKGHNYPVRAI